MVRERRQLAPELHRAGDLDQRWRCPFRFRANRLFEVDLTTPLKLADCVVTEFGFGLGDAWGVALDGTGDAIVAARNEGDFLRVNLSTGDVTPINTTDVGRPHEIVLLPEPGWLLQLTAGIGLLALLGRRRMRP